MMSGIKKHPARRLAGVLMLLQLLAWGSCSRSATIDVTLTGLIPGAKTLHFTVTDMNSGAARFQASLDQAVSRLQLDAGLLTTDGPFLLRVQALDHLPCTILSGTSNAQGFSLSGSRAEVSVALQTLKDDPCSVSVSIVGQEKEGVSVRSVPEGINCPKKDCKFSFAHGTNVTLHFESANPSAAFGGWDGPTDQCHGMRGATATTNGDGCVVTIPTVDASDGKTPIAVVAEAAPHQRCTGDLCFDSPHDFIKVLWGSSENDVWAGGPNGMLHFDGTRWRVAPGAPKGVTSVGSLWGRGPRDVWAIGDDPLRRGRSSVFHWDGKWSVVEQFRKYGRIFQLSGSENVDDKDIWLFGESTLATNRYSLYHFINGSIDEVPTPNPENMSMFFAGTFGDIWLVDNAIHHYFISQKSWKINEYVPSEGTLISNFSGFNDGSRDELWLVGCERPNFTIVDRAVATHFDGKNWRQYHLDPVTADDKADGSLYAVWARDNVVWLLGTHSSFRGVRPNRDAGFQWEKLTGEIPAVLWGADPKHVFGGVGAPKPIFGGPEVPGQLLINDGDKPKFKRIESVFPVKPLYGLSGNNRRDVWAVGDGGTVLHWDGSQWSPVEAPVKADLRGAWGDGKDGVWIVGEKGTVLHCQPSHCISINSGSFNDLKAAWGSSECPLSGCEDRQVWVVGTLNTVLNCSLTGCRPDIGLAVQGLPLDFNGVWGKSNGDVWLAGKVASLPKDKGVILHGTANPNAPPAYLPPLSWTLITPNPVESIWRARAAISIWGDPRGAEIWVGTMYTHCRTEPETGFSVYNDEIWHTGGIMNDWRFMHDGCGGYTSIWGSTSDDVWTVTDTFNDQESNLIQVSAKGPPYSAVAGYPLQAVWGSGRGEIWAVGRNGVNGDRGVIVRRRAP